MSGRDGEPIKWRLAARWIPEKSDAGQWYTAIQYGVLDNVWIGADFRPRVDELNWIATWRILDETDDRPAVILGTMVDDFDDVQSRHYYVTLSKNVGSIEVGPLGVVHLSPFGGATYIEELEELDFAGGLHLASGPNSAMIQYTGVETHLTLSHTLEQGVTLSFVWWGLKFPGLAVAYAF